ncbi:hypothetical protein BH18ACI4_BH18ACI4_23290 [soil metagenome]
MVELNAPGVAEWLSSLRRGQGGRLPDLQITASKPFHFPISVFNLYGFFSAPASFSFVLTLSKFAL